MRKRVHPNCIATLPVGTARRATERCLACFGLQSMPSLRPIRRNRRNRPARTYRSAVLTFLTVRVYQFLRRQRHERYCK